MSVSGYTRLSLIVAITVVSIALETRVDTQQRGGTPQTDKVAPVNSGANPYRIIRDWAQLNPRQAVSVRKGTPFITSMKPARKSEASAAACSCGRTASTSIARATCG